MKIDRLPVKPSFKMQAHQELALALERTDAHGLVIFAIGPDGAYRLETVWLPNESITGFPRFDLLNAARVALEKEVLEFLE